MAEKNKIYFYKGNEEVLTKPGKEADIENPTERIRDSFAKVLDGKNLSFLLGCGCSSFVPEGDTGDTGIPTMTSLANEFYSRVLSTQDKDWLRDKLKVDVTNEKFKTNLESLLGALHSFCFFCETTDQQGNAKGKRVQGILKQARDFLIKKCLNEDNRKNNRDKDLVELYKSFYRKLLYRNSNLLKPNIFTTNYDLYSEIALDKLGIHYVNGFSGGIKKYFNPTIFNYALAEKMDLSQGKWSVIDNFIYLYKLHGSLNWIQDEEDSKLFKVREIQETTYDNLKAMNVIMIHPTPLKYNASMGSPYSDLFREFQKKLMQNNNVLVTVGYSFSDEHINNLIYQAFTIPSFRLIVLGDPESSKEIARLQLLDDPRIWIIGGELEDGSKLHFFKGVVNYILPDESNDEIDKRIQNVIDKLFGRE